MRISIGNIPVKITACVVAVALFALGLTLGCSDKPSQNGDRVNAKMKISIPKTSFVNEIDIIRLQIVSDDEVVDSRETALIEGKFDFGTFTIPTGELTFFVAAVDLPLEDDEERILYASSQERIVEPGDDVTLEIELLPAVPMVRLSPFYSEAPFQTIYTATLELWNLSSFNNGTFRIDFDPDYLSFDGAVQANNQWGNLDILASFDAGGVTLDIDRLSGSDLIGGSPELVRIRFNTLSLGTQVVDLSVEALSNNTGIVPEFAAGLVYIDDATVEIVENLNFGTLTGTVRNASDNEPIAGALVTITGPTSNETNTNSQGQFEFTNLPFGTYQLEVIAEGFITRTSTQVVDEQNEIANISLSSSLAEGQYRVVLTWGEVPGDIDAYYFTVIDNVPYSVYFAETGSSTQPPFAVLDVDDRDGFGPETITVFDQPGTAVFAVHNFDQDIGGGEITLGQSEATVELYFGNELLQSFSVSPSATLPWWHVFELGPNGELIVIDEYSDSPPAIVAGKQIPLPEKTAK